MANLIEFGVRKIAGVEIEKKDGRKIYTPIYDLPENFEVVVVSGKAYLVNKTEDPLKADETVVLIKNKEGDLSPKIVKKKQVMNLWSIPQVDAKTGRGFNLKIPVKTNSVYSDFGKYSLMKHYTKEDNICADEFDENKD